MREARSATVLGRETTAAQRAAIRESVVTGAAFDRPVPLDEWG